MIFLSLTQFTLQSHGLSRQKQKDQGEYYGDSLLTGSMSFPFSLLRLYETTHNSSYLKKALALTKFLFQSKNQHPIGEFINGVSGTLLALMRLHAISKEEWLLN